MKEIERFTEYLKNEKDYSPNTLESYLFTFRDFFTRFKIVSNDTVRDYIKQLENYLTKLANESGTKAEAAPAAETAAETEDEAA